MVLGDLGADVVRVEPPEGSPARRRGPMLAVGEESLRSLQFQAYNRSKRSIALDLSAAEDRATFLELVARSDIVLESGPPGELETSGLGFDQLREANPWLVYVRITPFGSDGPYAGYAASDLTLAAMGGPMMLQGMPDRAPVRISVPQVWRHTGVEAAVAALVGLARVRSTGEAQSIDVSAQSAMTWTMLEAMDAHAIQGSDFERSGATREIGTARVSILYPAADGDVIFSPLAPDLEGVVAWMVADGVVPEDWRTTEDWRTYFLRLRENEPLAYPAEEVLGAMGRFFAAHTREALLERGLTEGVAVAPVNTLADLTRFQQLAARDYWRGVELADGTEVPAPGGFVRLSGWRIEVVTPAPALNAHAEEIRAELAQVASPPALAGASDETDASELPFAGVKVADFSWVGVGPITAKYLADHGANVIRVESELRPDILRGGPPFKEGLSGLNRSQFFGDFNTSKRGIALDLRTPEGLSVAKRLIAWADICIESFAAGKLEALGLGPDVVRELNPSLVMVDTCLMGQTGPAAGFAGFGFHAAAIAGFYDVTGWPDRPPDGPWTAYTDTVSPRFLAATVMAALDHRRRTGEGHTIDAAQIEMALQFLAPEILNYHANAEVPGRLGNGAPGCAPHAVYPCAGDDQWCAIAVETDAHWVALRDALANPEWASDSVLDRAAGRVKCEAEIDEGISAWTRRHSARAVMETLQAAGVPAGVAMRSSDLLADPQYGHRRFYRYHEHPEMGRVPYAGHQFRIAGYDGGPRGPAPLLGEHTFEILRDDLGLSEDQIAELAAAEALR